MKTTSTTIRVRRSLVAVVAALGTIAVAACDRAPRLEVQTLPLEHLTAGEAVALIDPYVYGDREGAPGTLSVGDGAITVRETGDNLDRIARVLAEYDRPQPETTLHFQLIEADGFTTSDPRIADVESELRKIFRFGGYRLAGEAFVSATEGADFVQGLSVSGELFEISGEVWRPSAELIRLEGVRLFGPDGVQLHTTVNVRPGQTLVVGSSPRAESTVTLLLTVRAEEGTGPAD